MPTVPPIVPNAFKARQGYYPNPVPLSGLSVDPLAAVTELGRYVGEEFEQIQSRLLGISGRLPLPIQGTDALLVGRGDEIFTIDLWDYYFSTLAVAGFYGAPSDILNPGPIPTDIVGWPEQIQTYHFDPLPDPVTGIITAPEAGLYRLSCKIVWLQPSITQNFSYLLQMNFSVGGNFVLDAVDVSSNQTEWRALGGTVLVPLTAGEEVKLQLTAVGASPGLADMQPSSFELELVAPEAAP